MTVTAKVLELEKEALLVVKSRYLLCILVTQRIHQLEKGAQPSIDASLKVQGLMPLRQ